MNVQYRFTGAVMRKCRFMALRNIREEGDPILKKVCRPVTKFDDRLAQLLDDMGETMLEANGMGLAGPQVGVMRRVFVALDEKTLPDKDMTAEELEKHETKWIEFINPEILEKEGEIRGYEGCLSFPGQYAAIARPQKVKVRAFDRNGEPFEMEVEAMMARCVCHETNHLDGITIDELAEYFYDPEQPHDLDDTLYGDDEEQQEQPSKETADKLTSDQT